MLGANNETGAYLHFRRDTRERESFVSLRAGHAGGHKKPQKRAFDVGHIVMAAANTRRMPGG